MRNNFPNAMQSSDSGMQLHKSQTLISMKNIQKWSGNESFKSWFVKNKSWAARP